MATLGAVLFAVPVSAQEDLDPEQGGVYLPPEDPPPEELPPPVDTTRQQTPQERAWYEGGPTGTTPEPPPRSGSGLPSSIGSESPPDESSSSSSSSAPDGLSDHARSVGRVAVGFMGAAVIPLGDGSGGLATVTAPALGIRYWFADLVGLDIGLGLGIQSGTTVDGTTSSPVDDAFAFLLHVGVPLAIFHESHFSLLIIPEINLGYATGTLYGVMPDQDRGRAGVLFQIGGRIGTEIHFGFMEIPQLSLQASVGLYLDYQTGSSGQNRMGSVNSRSRDSISFGTTVIGEPWDIFLGALTALYYFE